jgi:TolA-binding protein
MTHRDVQKKLVATAILVLGCVTFVVQGQSQEEAAQRRYDSGRVFYDAGKYAEALRDFQAVVESYPTSSVADKALLDIATYQLDVAGDPSAALTSIENLLKKYPNAESAPMGLVMQGRITLAKGLSGADIDSALANFDRVPRLFPGTAAVPAALFFSGRALRLGHRDDEALDRYSQVASEYPSSIWAMRARAGMAISFTLTGNPTRAMQELQRIRAAIPNSPEAANALAWNTILYRLYVRPPAQPPYALAKRSLTGPGGKMKDVLALGVDAANRLFVVNKSAVQVFDEKGAAGAPLRETAPTGIFFDTRGVPITITETALSPNGRPSLTLAVTQNDGKVREIRGVTAGVAISTGDYLVANPDQKLIERFSPSGTFVGRFASADVNRLAIDFLDNVAALEGNAKTVTIFNRDGKQIGRIQPRGTNYELKEPVDLAFDALGHLYVLDRNRGTVFVFSNNGTKLVTSFSLPEKSPGAFFHARALGLDGAGRLYIFDDQAERIQIYQ